MNTMDISLEQSEQLEPLPSLKARIQRTAGMLYSPRRRAPLIVTLVTLPFFFLMGWLLIGWTGVAGFVVMVTPALFYGIYGLTMVRRAEHRLTLRYRRLESEVMRRVNEFAPNDIQLSRQYFESRLAQEVSRSRRHRIPLCVVTLSTSIPRPGATHASDLVKATSRILRAEDFAGRLKRNEYALCLPHTTPAGASVVIDRLRREFQDAHLRIGLAYLEPGHHAEVEHLLRRAFQTPAA